MGCRSSKVRRHEPDGNAPSVGRVFHERMYQGDLRPVGLHIENGRELTPANIATLTGAPSQIPNFYKKPKRSASFIDYPPRSSTN